MFIGQCSDLQTFKAIVKHLLKSLIIVVIVIERSTKQKIVVIQQQKWQFTVNLCIYFGSQEDHKMALKSFTRLLNIFHKPLRKWLYTVFRFGNKDSQHAKDLH